MIPKKALNTILLSAVAAVASAHAASAHMETTDSDKEKCYGVAKASSNDCASASGSHGCAAQAPTDRDGNEWINVPKGLCEKLAGGSLTPVNAPAKTGEGHSH